jgi:hypothetical protein
VALSRELRSGRGVAVRAKELSLGRAVVLLTCGAANCLRPAAILATATAAMATVNPNIAPWAKTSAA